MAENPDASWPKACDALDLELRDELDVWYEVVRWNYGRLIGADITIQ